MQTATSPILSEENRLQLAHLEAELAYVDLLLRREVRRWVLAGQDPNDDYRGLYVTQAEAETLLVRPLGKCWGQMIELPEEEAAAFTEAVTQASQASEEAAQKLKTEGLTPRLWQLAAAFELDRTALKIFLLAAAPAFDTKYDRLYGFLQDNVTLRRPSIRLMLDLLGEAGLSRFVLADYFQADAALFRFGLLERVVEALPINSHWLNQTLMVDESVVAWLLGHYQPKAALYEALRVEVATVGPLTDLLLADRPVGNASVAESGSIIVFYGADRLAQEAAAQRIAGELKQSLLWIDLTHCVNEELRPNQAVQMALRDAQMLHALPVFVGWDLCLTEERRIDPLLLNRLCNFPGALITIGRTCWQAEGMSRQRRIVAYEFGLPAANQREKLWQHFLTTKHSVSNKLDLTQAPTLPLSPGHPVTLSDLASQFALTSGQIRDAVAVAEDRAQQTGGALNIDLLFAAARSASQSRLDALAIKITPRHSWTDLILPDDQVAMLHELVATVRGRGKVLGEWQGEKLAASAGVSALFAGPPGTGKTMAAEVIAHALGYDLYKIDLSSAVSKYIGETEKNLERIFSEATSSNAILFFDEADALFGKRSEVKDAHDRFANIEISYLLQRMERYDGVAILATNLRAHLDDAFTRRLQFIVAFPFPQRNERYRIWQALFPPSVPRADDLDGEFKRLAERFELTGANIRNILYSAAHLAASNGQVVTKEYLRHGVKRELQKMGRTAGVE